METLDFRVACTYGDLKIAKSLSAEIINQNDYLFFIYASQNNHLNIVKWILEDMKTKIPLSAIEDAMIGAALQKSKDTFIYLKNKYKIDPKKFINTFAFMDDPRNLYRNDGKKFEKDPKKKGFIYLPPEDTSKEFNDFLLKN